jgi:hypothetical protein
MKVGLFTMAIRHVRVPARVINPLETSIRTANRIISQKLISDYVDHLDIAKLADDFAAALDSARLRREQKIAIRREIVAQRATQEIIMARQALGFPQRVQDVILRALASMED